MIGIGDLLAPAEADAGGQAVAGFHGDGQPGAMFGVIVVHDAGVPGHLPPGGRVEHRAVAAAPLNRDFLAAVEFVVGDLLAIARGGVDLDDRDRADDVEVAIDELPDAGGLVERPCDAPPRNALLQLQVFQSGRRGGLVFRVNDDLLVGGFPGVRRRGLRSGLGPRTTGQGRQHDCRHCDAQVQFDAHFHSPRKTLGCVAKDIPIYQELRFRRERRPSRVGRVLRVPPRLVRRRSSCEPNDPSGIETTYPSCIHTVFSSVYCSWAKIDLSRPAKPDSL